MPQNLTPAQLDEIAARHKAGKTQTADTPSSSPEGGSVSSTVKGALGLGTMVGLIPHPLARAVGGASGLALSAMEAREGNYGTAAVSGAFGGGSLLALLKGLKKAAPAVAPALEQIEQKAADLAKVRRALDRMKNPPAARVQEVKKQEAQLLAETRRLLRESRLTARELRQEGKPVSKELTQAMKRAADIAGRKGEELAAGKVTSAKTAAKGAPQSGSRESSVAAAKNAPGAWKDLSDLRAGGKPRAGFGSLPKETKFPESTSSKIASARKKTLARAEAQRTRADAVSKAEAAMNGALDTLERLNPTQKAAFEKTRKMIRDSLAKTPRNLTKKQSKMWDEAGQAASELMMTISSVGLGAAAGGAAGIAARPEDSERPAWQWAAAGAGAGALAGGNLSALALAPKGQKIAKAMDLNFFSLLSGPATLAKSTIGSLTGTMLGAAQRLVEGRPGDAAKIMKAILTESASGTWVKAFRDPKRYMPPALLQKSKVPVKAGILGIPTRVIAAGDALSSRALMRGGFSREEALRFNLSGDPRTSLGNSIMALAGEPYRRGRSKKRGWADTELKQLAMRYFLPFPRVAAQIAEMGLEFSPAPLMSQALRSQLGHKTMRETVAKATLGPLAGLGGAAATREISPDLDPLAATMFGPLTGWASLGQGMQRNIDSDRPVLSGLNQFMADVHPMVGEMFSFSDLPARFVPGAARDVAKAIDPAFGRETGPQAVGEGVTNPIEAMARGVTAKAASRFPVFRETLPERPMPVDVFGSQMYPDRPAFIPDITLRGFQGEGKIIDVTAPKVWTSTPIQNPPVFPLRNPTAQAVRGIQQTTGETILAPPSLTGNENLEEVMNLQGQDMPPVQRDVRLAALRARGIPVEATLKPMVSSPQFQSLPPQLQSLVLRRVIGSTRSAVSPSVGGLVNTSILNPSAQGDVRRALMEMIQGFERGM